MFFFLFNVIYDDKFYFFYNDVRVDDVVLMLFFSGIIGLLKGVELIYSNLMV